VRQAILCAADVTLEHGVQGWDSDLNKTAWLYGNGGPKHVCRDWNSVVDYVTLHRTGDNRDLLFSKGAVEVEVDPQ